MNIEQAKITAFNNDIEEINNKINPFFNDVCEFFELKYSEYYIVFIRDVGVFSIYSDDKPVPFTDYRIEFYETDDEYGYFTNLIHTLHPPRCGGRGPAWDRSRPQRR